VIDLAEPGNSRAIRGEVGAWRIVNDPGVMFIRPETLRTLPEPVRGGDLKELWDLVNIPENARLLVLAWLMDSLRPDTPFPLLELIGEQGSAKSLTQTILRSLIDPDILERRFAPRGTQDLYVSAASGWLLSLDNISHLSPDMQDALCCLAYGTAYATRRLYTDADQYAIRAARPIVLNGVGATVTAQDLLDRTISLELPQVEERREWGELIAAFQAAHGRILGALLDLFVAVLPRLPATQIPRERRPRLIEYARLGCAAAAAMGQPAEIFLDSYEAARAEAVGRTIDASPVATALIEWLEGRPDREGEHAIKALFEILPKPQNGEAWPKSPKGFADALRRAAPALRTRGIWISRGRQSHGKTLITISRERSPGQSHPHHPSHPNEADGVTSETSVTSFDGFSRDDIAPEAF
jgi:hypothetical protein